MKNKLSAPTRLSKLVFKRLLEVNKTQKEIAEAVGFRNQNMITMIKQGDAKLPLDRVPAMAKVLDVDPAHMLRLALEQFYDNKAVSELVNIMGARLSANEAVIVDKIREISGDTDPALTAELEACLKKALARVEAPA